MTTLGKTAADADPEQYGAMRRSRAWENTAAATPERNPAAPSHCDLTEQKSSNPGRGVADAYAPSGASRCAANVTSTTPMRKRDFI